MNIVVGVTGGIAAYKTVQLVRLFVKGGHDVTVIPTADALRFVGTPTWEAISRNTVTTSVHDDVARVRHVALGQAADLIVIAPATANTIAKMTAGLADDLLGTTLLATTAPVAIAPAMHTEMWRHPATQANIATLRDRGVHILGPAHGELTGGDSGPGRMLEPEEIHTAALALLAPQDLAGRTIAISAGGTREPIDPVRFLGNRSSGRQGAEVALAAADRGATVRLVAAHVDEGVLAAAERHPLIDVVRLSTAAELETAMTDAAASADVVVMVAAVADFRVAEVSHEKIRKENGAAHLDLVENPDILAGLVAARRPGQTVVGFAAETARDDAELRERGMRKRARKGVDLLAVNRVDWDAGFEAADNAVLLIDGTDAVVAEAAGSKRAVADALWDAVLALR
ncbi:bifunctional phosphopantothenoylcysteine decarboxylase/phosphopantothenate--cysteine ligase CoaBC [Microbacterium sp.]|uniref:bifunctional phosphopantothenoylcysteine decarboxylase/phosphopantothenate--cysteine ligase CoaBC n=1 Tax=Microbacterium sp. TaxID=51671 RepID=UPI003736C35B